FGGKEPHALLGVQRAHINGAVRRLGGHGQIQEVPSVGQEERRQKLRFLLRFVRRRDWSGGAADFEHAMQHPLSPKHDHAAAAPRSTAKRRWRRTKNLSESAGNLAFFNTRVLEECDLLTVGFPEREVWDVFSQQHLFRHGTERGSVETAAAR